MDATTYAYNLRALFQEKANPLHAPAMEKYMLNQFRFFGIPSPERKLLTRDFKQQYGLPAPIRFNETVRLIWEMEERELQYAIMEIISSKQCLKNPERIHLFEEMIVNRSWWDTVDYIASNLVGPWMSLYPERTAEFTESWLNSGNLWLQRTVLLFQLKYRDKTDEQLLFNAIRQLTGSREFFIRKAIGWALREYSKTRPGSVIRFVEATALSPLSRREAMKVILKNKTHE
jgi:3-methyladenine DNA glycosylase AlkD